jgi:hypothetical protein
VLPVHTLVVKWLALQYQVMARDTPPALGTRHELPRTVGAVHLRVVVVVGSHQLCSTSRTHEVLLMVVLASSSHKLGAIETLVALCTVGVGAVMCFGLYNRLPLVLCYISLSRRSSSMVCVLDWGRIRLHRGTISTCVVGVVMVRGRRVLHVNSGSLRLWRGQVILLAFVLGIPTVVVVMMPVMVVCIRVPTLIGTLTFSLDSI